MQDNSFEEVLFSYHSPLLDQEVEELLWCKALDADKGHYELHSVPFYGPEIACGDHFKANQLSDSSLLSFENVLKKSGNSIVQVIVENPNAAANECLLQLEEIGCRIEKASEHLRVACILKNKDYVRIYQCMLPYVQKEVIEFAEAHLSNKHQKDLRRGGYQL